MAQFPACAGHRSQLHPADSRVPVRLNAFLNPLGKQLLLLWLFLNLATLPSGREDPVPRLHFLNKNIVLKFRRCCAYGKEKQICYQNYHIMPSFIKIT